MRALAAQVMPSANSRQSSREHSSAREAGEPQILIETADRGITDNVARRRRWICRNRHAARQGFEQHQAERVGAAREHEHVGSGINPRQFLAMLAAEKHRVRIGPRQLRARRSVADHDFGAGQIELKKGLDILFHRQAPDGQEYRPRQIEHGVAARPE